MEFRSLVPSEVLASPLLCPDFLLAFFFSSGTAKHENLEETRTRLFDWANVMRFLRYGEIEKDTGKRDDDIARKREGEGESESRGERRTKKCVERNKDNEAKGKRGKDIVNERKRGQREKRIDRDVLYRLLEGAWALSQRVRSFGEGALVGDKRETYEG